MTDIRDPASSHHVTLRMLLDEIRILGGDEDTPLTIEADGEPVYIYTSGGE